MSYQGRPKLRTIIEQQLVTAALKRAKQEYPRIDELFEGIKWMLARNPTYGASPVRHNEVIVGYVRRNKAWKGGRIPAITITYTVTDNEVTVEAITIREE